MNNLFLIAEAADARFAVPAAAVENVVRRMEVVPVPLADPCVAGIAALRSRVITVIDLMAAITGLPGDDCVGKPVIVTRIDGHYYGFAVDRVHDIVDVSEAPKPVDASMSAAWQAVALGFIESKAGAMVVVDPGRLLGTKAKAA